MSVVSIFMITYNHGAFIVQAIESIVSQKTNFDFELIIGEDISTDNTRQICEEYAAKYPSKINLLPSDKKYGPIANSVRTLEACTGKYVAMCEGDDYWTDPYKLQKQVDFLEANPDYTICFSGLEVIDEMKEPDHYTKNIAQLDKDIFTIEDFIMSEMNITPTPTVLFRNVLPRPLPRFFTEALAGDMPLQLLLADKGKARYMPVKMAAYRNHAGGVTKSKENIEKGEAALRKVYIEADKYFDHKYSKIFKKRLHEMAKTKLLYGASGKRGMGKVKHYFHIMPDYLKYGEGINVKEIFYHVAVLFFPRVLKNYKKNK